MLPRNNNIAEQRMAALCKVSWAYSHFIFSKGNSIVRETVHEFKYHNNPKLAFEMGVEVGTYMKQNGMSHLFDIIIPVPISWRRRFSRGYNQAGEFAKGIAQATGKEIRTDILKRRSWASSQSTRNAEERIKAMSDNAFSSNGKINELRNRKIALVDDVLTTGSTLAACCEALRRNAAEIDIGILTFSIDD